MIKHNACEFLLSCALPEQLPEANLQEVVLVGKSNVGKSSLINALCQRKNLAYVGSAPGKTTMINFYEINNHWHLVDVPGYGYAKLSKKELARIDALMSAYFHSERNIVGMIIIVDARRDISELDDMMIDIAAHLEIPYLLVFSKIDKIRRNKLAQLKIKYVNQPVAFFSALQPVGIPVILDKIYDWIQA
jgi:GTP-binding protein